MQAIQCPNCGYGSCTQIDDEKWSCPACDHIFTVHNLSREFRATDEHISQVHQDLKASIKNIGRMADRNYLDEESTLEKAETHLRNGDFPAAEECFSEVAEEYPMHSAGWYGRFRAITGNFTQVERYALFLCGGIPAEFDRELVNEGVQFLGCDDVRKALSCEDADEETIVGEVADFLGRCAEYGKQEAEETILDAKESYKDVIKQRDLYIKTARAEKAKGITKALIPALIVLLLIGAVVLYLTKLEEKVWVIPIVLILLVIIFKFRLGGKILGVFGKGISEAVNESAASKAALADLLEENLSVQNISTGVLRSCCIDIDNYNYIINAVNEDPWHYIEEYINDPLENMTIDDLDEETDHAFIIDFLSGNIERFNYLSGIEIDEGPVSTHGKDKMSVMTTSIVSYMTFIGWVIAYNFGASEGADFYLNQALIYNILVVLLGILSLLLNNGASLLVTELISFVFFIIGITYAANQKQKELPLIGKLRILKYPENREDPDTLQEAGEQKVQKVQKVQNQQNQAGTIPKMVLIAIPVVIVVIGILVFSIVMIIKGLKQADKNAPVISGSTEIETSVEEPAVESAVELPAEEPAVYIEEAAEPAVEEPAPEAADEDIKKARSFNEFISGEGAAKVADDFLSALEMDLFIPMKGEYYSLEYLKKIGDGVVKYDRAKVTAVSIHGRVLYAMTLYYPSELGYTAEELIIFADGDDGLEMKFAIDSWDRRWANMNEEGIVFDGGSYGAGSHGSKIYAPDQSLTYRKISELTVNSPDFPFPKQEELEGGEDIDDSEAIDALNATMQEAAEGKEEVWDVDFYQEIINGKAWYYFLAREGTKLTQDTVDYIDSIANSHGLVFDGKAPADEAREALEKEMGVYEACKNDTEPEWKDE
ncbi:MAG: hypothetical protein K5668_04210 [Lachnospiraceae bacterium]|nr:hypothetical protein [Lachnospiraceae bacterium]